MAASAWSHGPKLDSAAWMGPPGGAEARSAPHRRALLLPVEVDELRNVSNGVCKRPQLARQNLRARTHPVQRQQP
jgi:hypothetical protein